jgi:hypothetical protein
MSKRDRKTEALHGALYYNTGNSNKWRNIVEKTMETVRNMC